MEGPRKNDASDDWRIYYDDGSIFYSSDGEWNQAPVDGVLFVAEKRGDVIDVYSSCDFYVRNEDGIQATHDLGPFLRRLGFIKFGRFTSHKKFEDATRRVREDCDRWRRSPST